MNDNTAMLESITELVRTRAVGREFPYTVKFRFPDTTCLHVDGTKGPVEITNHDDPAQVTLKMTPEDFVRMFTKEISAQRAAVTGKIKFEGNVAPHILAGWLG